MLYGSEAAGYLGGGDADLGSCRWMARVCRKAWVDLTVGLWSGRYVLDLAKYDLNYDLRDRARYVRAVLHIKDTKLHKHAKHLFLTTKPAPEFQSMYEAHHRFPSGTLSHMMNEEVTGYVPMPVWTTDPSDPELRNHEDKVYEGISSDS
jgi:hypothetical protein